MVNCIVGDAIATQRVKNLRPLARQCQATRSNRLRVPADVAFLFVMQKGKNEPFIRKPQGNRLMLRI